MKNNFRILYGEPIDRTANKVRPYMVDWVQEFIKQSPFAIMATSDSEGNCDASPKGGKPGFIKVIDKTHLLIPDVAGNKLFQSYENIESNSKIGIIFFIPGVNECARVNGRVSIIRNGDPVFDKINLEVFEPDENAKVLQALLLEVDESYGHCSRALNFSKTWDIETIANNQNNPPIGKKPPGT
ncbi:MAG: pyridoxamine 5'-phosphate oxidase family protein [Gammaproteobacteria bacterium]|jgi:PPOX class probable FMN-dependent enzyme